MPASISKDIRVNEAQTMPYSIANSLCQTEAACSRRMGAGVSDHVWTLEKVIALLDKVKVRSKAALSVVGCALAIYVGSYIYLSAHGRYGTEFPGSLIEGSVSGWQPKGLHDDKIWYQWNHELVEVYLPLLLLDRALWHRTIDKRASSQNH